MAQSSNNIISRWETADDASLFKMNSQPGGNDGDENDDGPLLPPRRRTSKRKLKNVVKFDPRPFPGRRADDDAEKETKVCRVGEGFACPRCYGVCSYDARSCPNCDLECYYEAGVGAVTLKERNDLTMDDKSAANNKTDRKRRVPYTDEERRKVLEGVERFGVGSWVKILEHYDFAENGRTAVNLKDLYRTLTKVAKMKK